MERADVAVIGGGVVGLGITWRLAEAGRRVVVVDRGEIGRGASWAAAGMLAPAAEIGFEELDLYALGRESLARWPSFAQAVEAASGLDVGYRDEGTLIVSDDRDTTVALRRLYRFQQEHDVPVEWLSGSEAADAEPLLSPRLPAAIFSPTDHQVDNRALVRALRLGAERAGAALREHAEVVSVEPGAPAVLRLGAGEGIEAEIVVLAAGAWSAGVGGLAPSPPVRPVKGQMLSLRQDPEAGLELRHVVRGPDAYLVPKGDGRLVVGATSEEVGADTRVTGGGVYRLLEGAVEVVPGIEEMDLVETWAGLRPASRDHAPLLGDSPHEGVVYATGHYRHGVLLAPVTADEVAAHVLARLDGRTETRPILSPFSPLRFETR
ncbi:MAG: glycine oxidase ThiO [Bacteroidota bacterium]